MTDYADALQRELDAAITQSRAAVDHDPMLLAVDRFAVLIRALDDARRKASDHAKSLIAVAIADGADPREFYGRPFSGTVIRELARTHLTSDRYSEIYPHRGRRPQNKPRG